MCDVHVSVLLAFLECLNVNNVSVWHVTTWQPLGLSLSCMGYLLCPWMTKNYIILSNL